MTAPDQLAQTDINDRTQVPADAQDASAKFRYELEAERRHPTNQQEQQVQPKLVDSASDMIDKNGRYTVQPGESLWSIARDSLQNAGFDDIDGRMIKHEIKRLIYLNKREHPGLVRNPGSLKEGWELQIIAPEDVADRNERNAKYGDLSGYSRHQTKPNTKSDVAIEKSYDEDSYQPAKVLDKYGCPLDTPWRDAPPDQKTHVFNCEKIRAVSNSTVIAHQGAEVQAQRGSLVLGLPGSRITALYQSRVASYKAEVDAWKGSEVMDVAP
jgi:hypothetical protein